MRYFIMSSNCNCTDPLKWGFIKSSTNGIYLDPKDNSEWTYMAMLDFGRCQEWGMCRLPFLSKDKLFEIVFSYKTKDLYKQKKWDEEDYNFYGSLASLIQRYPYDLLEEVDNRLMNNMINSDIIKHIRIEFDCSDNIIDRLSDKK